MVKDPNIILTLILSLVGGIIAIVGQFYESIDNMYCLISGFILFIGFGGYSIYLHFKNKEYEEIELPIWKILLFIVLGIAMIIFGSEFAVKSATSLAKEVGLSDSFIGLTVVALGTSLPELFTSVSASLKKNSDIAIGNVVGSNILNILLKKVVNTVGKGLLFVI